MLTAAGPLRARPRLPWGNPVVRSRCHALPRLAAPRRVSWSWLAVTAGLSSMARAAARRSQRLDSHLHLWTPDEATYPWATAPPEHLNDGRATTESFLQLMDANGIEKAVVVQPINYGQDYKYLLSAMQSHPERLLGVFVADPTVAEPEKWMEEIAKSNRNWVGIRFNPYKWPEGPEGMADETGKRLFRKAGELGLAVGVMPFKGLSQHLENLEELLKFEPKTQVIIDHWGFFLQPATGLGERSFDEASWKGLLKLSQYPQVHVKISALFRVAPDALPFLSLSDRLKELLKTFGSQRLLWGSDFPYALEHSSYAEAVQAPEAWPIWQEMSEEDRRNLLHDTCAKLYGLPLLKEEL